MAVGLSVDLAAIYLGPRYLTEDAVGDRQRLHADHLDRPISLQAVEAFLSMNNLFDENYSEGQLDYISRLPREQPPEGVADVHFTPGAPFSVFGGLAVRF